MGLFRKIEIDNNTRYSRSTSDTCHWQRARSGNIKFTARKITHSEYINRQITGALGCKPSSAYTYINLYRVSNTLSYDWSERGVKVTDH